MSALAENTCHRAIHPEARQPRSGSLLGVILLLLGGLLIFAHGCHGDDDTELFATDPGRLAPRLLE